MLGISFSALKIVPFRFANTMNLWCCSRDKSPGYLPGANSTRAILGDNHCLGCNPWDIWVRIISIRPSERMGVISLMHNRGLTKGRRGSNCPSKLHKARRRYEFFPLLCFSIGFFSLAVGTYENLWRQHLLLSADLNVWYCSCKRCRRMFPYLNSLIRFRGYISFFILCNSAIAGSK